VALNTWFILFCALCAGGTLLLLAKPSRLYEYPYFMGAAFTAFILPQLFGLSLVRRAEDRMFSDVCMMAVLCYAACFIGYGLRISPWLVRWLNRVPHAAPGKLEEAVLTLAGVSFVFSVLIYRMPAEAKAGLWTGTVTKYLFFARLADLAFPLCLFVAIRYRRKAGWAAAALSAAFPFSAVVFYGRREVAVRLAMSIAVVLFLTRRKAVPRWLLAAGILAAALIIPAIGQYRKVAEKDPVAAARNLKPGELWGKVAQGESGTEVQNAMYLIAGTKAREDYGLGRGYWNQIVFAFVPAQYLGMEFKRSLMLGEGPIADVVQVMEEGAGYRPGFGTTVTGLGDSFHQFGYAGPLVFFALGWFFRRLWWITYHSQSEVLGGLYACLVPSAMKTVTHWTQSFLPELIYFTLFSGLVVWYSRIRVRRAGRNPGGVVVGWRSRSHGLGDGEKRAAVQNPARRPGAVAG